MSARTDRVRGGGPRQPDDRDDDLVWRALCALPSIDPSPRESARIQARATAAFVATAQRRRGFAAKATLAVRPLLPLSLAGMALGYLLWVCRQITDHWR